MTLQRPLLLSLVQAFVKRTRGVIDVDEGTALLAEGLLDSFGFVELSGEIARGLGVSLASGTLLPEDFESVAVLDARLADVLDP